MLRASCTRRSANRNARAIGSYKSFVLPQSRYAGSEHNHHRGVVAIITSSTLLATSSPSQWSKMQKSTMESRDLGVVHGMIIVSRSNERRQQCTALAFDCVTTHSIARVI